MSALRRPPSTERAVEARFVDLCRREGLDQIKIQRLGVPGYPDRQVHLPGGFVVWVELKRPGGELSKRQRLTQERLRQLGHAVGTFDCAEDAIDFVRGAAAGAGRLRGARGGLDA